MKMITSVWCRATLDHNCRNLKELSSRTEKSLVEKNSSSMTSITTGTRKGSQVQPSKPGKRKGTGTGNVKRTGTDKGKGLGRSG